MREDIEYLIRRAEVFIRDAKYDLENGDYDIAMFHIEQALQLLIKAKLLDLKGSYEKTHSLRKLLGELSKIYKEDEIKKFIEKYKRLLRDLERAYISSRYFYEEFFPEEVEEALSLYNELRDLLWKE